MRKTRGCSCINGRATAIGVGVITTLLWLPLVYISALGIAPYRSNWQPHNHATVMNIPLIGCLIFTLSSVAMSVLMVVGAVKRNVNFMFPWLAIHFALLLAAISLSFSYVIITVLLESASTCFLVVSLWMLATIIVSFLWGVVYLHYTSLSTPMTPVEPMTIPSTCLNENKILKALSQPDIPYHPI